MDGINSGDDFEEKENTFYNGIHCSFELYQLIIIPTYLSTAKKNEVGGVMTVEGPWDTFGFPIFEYTLHIFSEGHYFNNLHQNFHNSYYLFAKSS